MSRHEQRPERIPSYGEILALIKKHAEGCTVLDERRDDSGIYLLEAKAPEKSPGDYTLYVYHRKGTFPGQAAAAVTTLEEVYHSNNGQWGGSVIADLDPETNEWVDKS